MKLGSAVAVAAMMLLAGAPLPARATTTEQLAVLRAGEVIGHVIATTQGSAVEVDYRIDENGRGPKHRELLRLDARGIPIEWRISGTSLMGGPVEEHFEWRAGRAEWRSQADQGAVVAAAAPLYVVNDESPWASGVYARALLAAPGQRLDVLPSGTLRLTRLREATLGSGATALATTVYRLQGIALEPTLVMLDERQHLVAQFSDRSVVVRAGYESEEPALLRFAAELQVEEARALQQRLGRRPAGPVRIRNVRVFDPASGSVGEPSTVVVMRDRIVDVLPVHEEGNDAEGQWLVDGEGGVLVPGLHDMHVHTSLASGLFHLAAGVTTVRDQGNSNTFLLDLVPRIEAGEIAGPRIVAGGLIEGRSPYSARMGRIPEGLDEALRTVDWYADRGYRHVKFYNSLTPDWVAPLAARAHARGLKVAGHIPAFMTPDRAIRDGYDDISHINQLMLGWLLEPSEDTRTPLRLTAMTRAATLDLGSPAVQGTIGAMVEHGVALDPTVAILERLMLSRAGAVTDADADFLSHLPVGYQRYRKRSYVSIASAEEDAAYRQGVHKMLELLKLLHERRVQLLPGTDDATGFMLHRELELYAQAGIRPADVLRLATLDAARYLGTDRDSGTIVRGKQADFVLLAEDPSLDIRAIKRPRLVVKGGVLYLPSEIHEALGIQPFVVPPRMQSPNAGGTVP